MIGHFLLTLTPRQEDRVLTIAVVPWPDGPQWSDGPCLLQAAQGAGKAYRDGDEGSVLTHLVLWPHNVSQPTRIVGQQFDTLCYRFGTARVAATIRARILANQVRRMLQAQPMESVVVV